MLPCAAPDVLVYPVYLTLCYIPHPGCGMPRQRTVQYTDWMLRFQATGRMGTQGERETETGPNRFAAIVILAY